MALTARSDTLAWWLFATALALSMVLSAQTLLAFGIPYDAPYGPFWAKLHPGSYVMVLALCCALLRHGNPLAALWQQGRRQPLVAAYLAGMVTVFAWSIARHGASGAAYIVQTLWMPALALFTLDLLAPRRRRAVLLLVMTLLCCNALLALGEYLFKVHLAPVTADQEGGANFRSTALLGHPLLNANVTVALLPAVLLLPWPRPAQLAAGLLLACAVLSFGGRTALVAGAAIYGLHALVVAVGRAVRGRYSYLQLTGGSAGALIGGAALVGLVAATGLGSRIFANLTWDSSANVRLRVWEAFDHLRGNDWLLGVPPLRIDRIAEAMGLDPRYEAIENFWVYAYLQFGAIGYLPFVTGLGCLIVLLLKKATPPMRSAVLVYFIVASTANSLSSKTISLTLLAVVVLAGAADAAPGRRVLHRSA